MLILIDIFDVLFVPQRIYWVSSCSPKYGGTGGKNTDEENQKSTLK